MTHSTAPLTAREETFCRTMAAGASSVMAARVAGVRPDSAAAVGAVLCGRTDIQDRIGILFAEREAEHAARLRRTIERLDQIHEAAFEKGQLGVAYKALTQVFRLTEGEARRLRQAAEELQLPALPPEFLPEPPPAPRPAPNPQTVAPMSGGDMLSAEVRRIMEAELGLPPTTPRPAGSPLTAIGLTLAGPWRAGPKPG